MPDNVQMHGLEPSFFQSCEALGGSSSEAEEKWGGVHHDWFQWGQRCAKTVKPQNTLLMECEGETPFVDFASCRVCKLNFPLHLLLLVIRFLMGKKNTNLIQPPSKG